MDATIYNISGKKAGTITLPENIFGVAWNDSLMHQVVTSMQDNARTNVAHTKTRGEVRGGGRKPWRQKGTGRARHGSSRSPIWRKGGVVFGPHPRSYVQAMPRKMRRLALRSALSTKVTANAFVVLNDLRFETFKTREFIKVLENLKLSDTVLLAENHAQQLQSKVRKTRIATHKALVVVAERDEHVFGSAANVANVKV